MSGAPLTCNVCGAISRAELIIGERLVSLEGPNRGWCLVTSSCLYRVGIRARHAMTETMRHVSPAHYYWRTVR